MRKEKTLQISQTAIESGETETVITEESQFTSLKVTETLSSKMTKHPFERLKSIFLINSSDVCL